MMWKGKGFGFEKRQHTVIRRANIFTAAVWLWIQGMVIVIPAAKE